MTDRRPRVAVLMANQQPDVSLAQLDPYAEILPVSSIHELLQLVVEGSCDGVFLGQGEGVEAPSGRYPTSQEILSCIADGVAVVEPDLRIIWYNNAFEEISDGEVRVGGLIYQALGCQQIEGPNFCPFTDCIAGARQAQTRLRLESGRHVDCVVQPLATLQAGSSVGKPLLCTVRDVTSEVRQREKLIAIHRAGLELANLSHEELSRMSTDERVDLLKANIIHYSKKILDFANLEIRLLQPGTKKLSKLLSEGMTEPAGQRDLYAEVDGNGVTGYVAATGASYLCDDVQYDPLYLPGVRNARSSMTVPIVYRDEVIGTFNVESTEPRRFTESDREFLEIFAREIAVALNTLELLQAEHLIARQSGLEAVLNAISLPIDEIVANGIKLLDCLRDAEANVNRSRDAIRQILQTAREIKRAIQTLDHGETHPTLATDKDGKSRSMAGRRVLVADSDAAIRRSAHQLLGQLGCEVNTARDGTEALGFAKNIEYNIVLADIRLPDMNGYEFFTQVRKLLPHAAVVLITGFGYDPTHSIVNARREGLRGVLYKPFRMERLVESIEEALGGRPTILPDSGRASIL